MASHALCGAASGRQLPLRHVQTPGRLWTEPWRACRRPTYTRCSRRSGGGIAAPGWPFALSPRRATHGRALQGQARRPRARAMRRHGPRAALLEAQARRRRSTVGTERRRAPPRSQSQSCGRPASARSVHDPNGDGSRLPSSCEPPAAGRGAARARGAGGAARARGGTHDVRVWPHHEHVDQLRRVCRQQQPGRVKELRLVRGRVCCGHGLHRDVAHAQGPHQVDDGRVVEDAAPG